MTIMVTMAHARAASLDGVGVLCAPGIRRWCQRYDINIRDFVEQGLPIERVEAIGDAWALRVAAIARAEAEAADHG